MKKHYIIDRNTYQNSVLYVLLSLFLLFGASAAISQPAGSEDGPKVYYEYDAAGHRVLRRVWVESDGRLAAPEQTLEEQLAAQDGFETSVYPNPVKDQLTVDVSPSILTLDEHRLTMTDMNGREIMLQNLNGVRTQLDVSGLAPGNYLVKIWALEHSNEWKLIKE